MPAAKIVSHPPSVSRTSTATFIFYSTYYDVDAYLCSLDRNAYKSCTLVKTYRGLENGRHSFAVKLVSDGVAGPATAYTWTVRKTVKVRSDPAPTVAITLHPRVSTDSTTASFGFRANEKKSTFACVLDSGSSSACKPPTVYTGLTPGYHTFAVRASAGGKSSRQEKFAWFISAVAPVNTSAPTIWGTAQEGKTLTASNGGWSGSGPISYTYQWQLCSGGLLRIATVGISGPVSCGDIVDATSSSYLAQGVETIEAVASVTSSALSAPLVTNQGVIEEDGASFSYTLRVVVTARNTAGQAVAVSSQTSTVLPAAPVNTVLPTISVTDPPTVGNTASVGSEGSWTGELFDTNYQWQRCDSSGNNCSNISGETSYSYSIQAADVGGTLRLTVTASNPGGSSSATSLPTVIVIGP